MQPAQNLSAQEIENFNLQVWENYVSLLEEGPSLLLEPSEKFSVALSEVLRENQLESSFVSFDPYNFPSRFINSKGFEVGCWTVFPNSEFTDDEFEGECFEII